MTATSPVLACFPAASVLTSVAMLRAICVSTGRSCTATLTHCGVHPVVALTRASTRASRDFSFERRFITTPFLVVILGIETTEACLRRLAIDGEPFETQQSYVSTSDFAQGN